MHLPSGSRSSIAALFLCGVAVSAAQPPQVRPVPPPKDPESHVQGRILLKTVPGLSEVELHAMAGAHGAQVEDRIEALGIRVLRLPAAAVPRVLAAWGQDERVEFAEADPLAHASLGVNDPYFTNGSQWHLSKIQAPAAWDYSVGSTGARVAVLDSGVDFGHPDLAGKLLQGYDFVNNDANPSDDHGHGTGVSGLIGAATHNGLGIAGVAGASPVLPVKVLDASGSGSHSVIAKGITWAADQGARIINLSLGGTSSSSTLQSAVDYAWSKGALILAASGNNGNDVPFYPAACNRVLAVAATNSSDTRPSWSNFGSYVDLAAPGESVLTTWSGSYSYVSGTSFACPVASGTASLIATLQPQLSNALLADLLLQSCDDIGIAGNDTSFGRGRVNAFRAVSLALSAAPADTIAPSVAFLSPAQGAILAGTVTISASGSDQTGVTRMELLVDGQVVAGSTSGSIQSIWNTTSALDGNHTIGVRAWDAAGNTSSSSISVTVRNAIAAPDTVAPFVGISSPREGDRVSGTVKVQVSGTDNVGVRRLELYVDGRLLGSSTTASATFNWNTRQAARGTHVLQAYAWDAASNVAASVPVNVVK